MMNPGLQYPILAQRFSVPTSPDRSGADANGHLSHAMVLLKLTQDRRTNSSPVEVVTGDVGIMSTEHTHPDGIRFEIHEALDRFIPKATGQHV